MPNSRTFQIKPIKGWIETIEQSIGDYEILAWMPLPKSYRLEN